VVRVRSSFHLRDIRQRHTLAKWSAELHGVSTELSARPFGPDVGEGHQPGWYVEDFEFTAGSGDLDLYNGRFTVTPEFPEGTYAYFVTIDNKGEPAFPYVLGRQYFGVVPDRQHQITAGVIKTFAKGGDSSPSLTSWLTKYNAEYAHLADGSTTWPGQEKLAHADIGEVLYSEDWVYVSGSGLASHAMGPWFSPDGSVFRNWPVDQNFQDRFPRHPQAASAKTTNMLGTLGRWVNGVALFNMLDGASWSNEWQQDMMSGPPGGPGRGPRPPRRDSEE
jgi:hypothetical protein